MRKLVLLLLSIFVLAACQKQVSPDNAREENGAGTENKNDKIEVCHKTGNGSWHTIHISENAVPAHLGHGDVVPDADGDGFTKVNPCGVGSQDDCDDNNVSAYPCATEICGNGVDENCNGQIDENCNPEVLICSQTWMVKNLDVTTYRNGDPIPQVTDPVAWASLTTGAWCYYENNPANGAVYGKLYNWYAVNDVRGLAPLGWHIPTDAEWITLETTCLGPTSVAGGKLKEAGTCHWLFPNTGATNSSGFTGLPGGVRNLNGIFSSIGESGRWWSSSEFSATHAGTRQLLYFDDNFPGGIFSPKQQGSSVRCVKD